MLLVNYARTSDPDVHGVIHRQDCGKLRRRGPSRIGLTALDGGILDRAQLRPCASCLPEQHRAWWRLYRA